MSILVRSVPTLCLEYLPSLVGRLTGIVVVLNCCMKVLNQKLFRFSLETDNILISQLKNIRSFQFVDTSSKYSLSHIGVYDQAAFCQA